MQIYEYHRDPYTISTDPARLDLAVVHDLIANYTYWAVGRSLETVRKAAANSLNYGVYRRVAGSGEEQVGYARVVTDYATFAWLCDVIIHPESRGAGLGKWLVQSIFSHPELINLRRVFLATRDAHQLYARYAEFVPLPEPDRWMLRVKPD